MPLNTDILNYNQQQSGEEMAICEILAKIIDHELDQASSKIWHAHPVWFLNDNPIVGYSKQKNGIRLLFWSGADFDETGLTVRKGKFKDASVFYKTASEIDTEILKTWLSKAKIIQWDYKNIVKRKGILERLS